MSIRYIHIYGTIRPKLVICYYLFGTYLVFYMSAPYSTLSHPSLEPRHIDHSPSSMSLKAAGFRGSQ